MHVRVAALAQSQDGLVTWWQLRAAGMSDAAILRPTERQLWRAATLTTRGSVLSHAAAAACWGFMAWDGYPTITRTAAAACAAAVRC